MLRYPSGHLQNAFPLKNEQAVAISEHGFQYRPHFVLCAIWTVALTEHGFHDALYRMQVDLVSGVVINGNVSDSFVVKYA